MRHTFPWRLLIGIWLALAGLAPAAELARDGAVGAGAGAAGAGAAGVGAAGVGAAAPPAVWVNVALPIEGLADSRAIQQIDHLIAHLPAAGPRPLLVVEFRGDATHHGQGSQFERSLALARYLASPKLRRVRTVAFVPLGLQGHAVLPALACEELVIGGEAEFGPAGQDEGSTDATVLQGYQEIVERRRTFPWPVVRGMLDRDALVSKVELADGVRYVLEDERRALEQQQPIRAVTTVKPAGELARFTGRDLRIKFGFASHLAADRPALATALGVSRQIFAGDPSQEGGWRLLRVEVRGPIHSRAIGWIRRSVEERLAQGKFNLLLVTIDSPGGSLADSLSLANFLAELDSGRIRSVAWVAGEARADAAIIALACDRLIMHSDATLGGVGTAVFAGESLASSRAAFEQLAERKQLPWSLLAAMVDPDVQLRKYVRADTNQIRLMSEEEFSVLDHREQWRVVGPVDTFRGIGAADVESLGLAELVADDLASIRLHYQLEDEGAVVEPTWAHLFVERLASPPIAGLLLFVALFALMFEFMTPAITGAGFVSAVCFLLYFWSQFLHGTAGWLEVLLFLAGVTGVLLELFVLPGVGILGFGGALLILVSLVLASQTFVVPHNRYQLQQLSSSLGVLIAGITGAVVALAMLRHMLPRSPVFRRLMLKPLDAQAAAELRQREAVADFSYLFGQQGRAVTALAPAGKARFGETVVNVVSQGELIDRDALLEVVECLGNRVVVREVTGPLG